MANVIRDPFHRGLASLINEELERRTHDLAHGSATTITEDVISVAEKYAAAVAYIRALEDVLNLCHQLESDQETTGPRAADVKVVER